MALTSGTRIGHYEILGLLGAGGMGEVYRALDPRLGREVAVKILPDALAADSERQKRFEIEARAAGAVNHPNIVTLHDVGMAGSAPYLVTEMLEGETLRALMARGALAPARAVTIAIQVARGLGAAHAKGIVHRDLKPENLFVLPDGRVKILDFGIAKLTRAEPEAMAETTPAFGALTQDGTILGTVSYMAPEQLRGQAVDRRADLFALGAILHEALVGRPAFGGDTAVDRVSAILSREPEPIAPEVDQALPGLAALIRRCLEKQPENRFESARDLAYALEILEQAGRTRSDAAHFRSTVTAATQVLDVQQITFREGRVGAARFAPDGVTVVYHAAWEGGPSEMYLARTDNPDYRPLNLGSAELFAVSGGAELLVGLDLRDVGGFVRLHTLARVSMLGGVPRELTRDVFSADWGPDGKSIAAIREVEGRFQLEYPLGRIVYQSSGSWFSRVRVSRSGQLAFFEHPQAANNFGHLMVLEPDGKVRKLASDLDSASSLVWHPAGKEIWFQAIPHDKPSGIIWSATLDGRVRPIYQILGWPDVQDLSPDGQLLVTRTDPRLRMQTGTRAGAGADRRELSWFEWSLARDISADGKLVLFDETGPSSLRGAVFVRAIDGSPAVRIAEGTAMGLFLDGEHVLALDPDHRTQIAIHPLGAGTPLTIDLGDRDCHFARAFPDGKSIAAVANRPDEPPGLYRIAIPSGECTRLTEHPFAMTHPIPTPDGNHVSMRRADGSFARFPVGGGDPIPTPGMRRDERPCGWSPDGSAVYVFQRGKIPSRVDRIDLGTGERTPWIELEPMNRSGTVGFWSVILTPDGERYAASFSQLANCLFAVKGLA